MFSFPGCSLGDATGLTTFSSLCPQNGGRLEFQSAVRGGPDTLAAETGINASKHCFSCEKSLNDAAKERLHKVRT